MTNTATRLQVDIIDGQFYAGDPWAAWAWMRRNEPVYHDEANGVWGVSRYEDVRTCSTDTSTYSNAAGIRPRMNPTPQMINLDPPLHTRRRKLVSAGFTPRSVAAMRERVGRVCDEIVDKVSEQGSCDFVHDIAAPLPLIMIADMLGVAADDREDLLRWSEDMLQSQTRPDPALIERATAAFLEYQGCIMSVIEDRRATGRTDDIIGILTNAEIDGDRLTDPELIFETLLILIGGDETTRHVLSGGMLALQQNPDQLTAVQTDPTRLPRAVEEMLRWVSPVKNMVRTVTRNVTLGGASLQEGDQLLLLYPSANRDEETFADADVFDIDRHPNPHLAFGLGTHFCLGNQLARLELNEMFATLLRRLPDLHLVPGAQLPLRAANFVSGLEQMRVAYTPSPRVNR